MHDRVPALQGATVRIVGQLDVRGDHAPAVTAVGCQALQQFQDFALPEPPVAARRLDGSDAPGDGPSRDGLRVHPEQGGYFARCEQPAAVAARTQRVTASRRTWTGRRT